MLGTKYRVSCYARLPQHKRKQFIASFSLDGKMHLDKCWGSRVRYFIRNIMRPRLREYTDAAMRRPFDHILTLRPALTVSSGASRVLSVSFSEPDFRLLSPTIHEGEGQVQLRFNVWEKRGGKLLRI